MPDLEQLAMRVEAAAIEQIGFAVKDVMPHDARQKCASFAANLLACAAALRARAQKEGTEC